MLADFGVVEEIEIGSYGFKTGGSSTSRKSANVGVNQARADRSVFKRRVLRGLWFNALLSAGIGFASEYLSTTNDVARVLRQRF